MLSRHANGKDLSDFRSSGGAKEAAAVSPNGNVAWINSPLRNLRWQQSSRLRKLGSPWTLARDQRKPTKESGWWELNEGQNNLNEWGESCKRMVSYQCLMRLEAALKIAASRFIGL